MKARVKTRVKTTGEIVEVVYNGFYYESIKDERIFDKSELEIIPKTKDPDYWTRLEHQYAGMAMQGLLQSPHLNIMQEETLVGMASSIAHALVEKMKEERK